MFPTGQLTNPGPVCCSAVKDQSVTFCYDQANPLTRELLLGSDHIGKQKKNSKKKRKQEGEVDVHQLETDGPPDAEALANIDRIFLDGESATAFSTPKCFDTGSVHSGTALSHCLYHCCSLQHLMGSRNKNHARRSATIQQTKLKTTMDHLISPLCENHVHPH